MQRTKKLPEDLLDQAQILSVALDISPVTKWDRSGRVAELSIPYGRPTDCVNGYRITRSGDQVSAAAVGQETFDCDMSPEQRRQVLSFCRSLDSLHRRKRLPRRGSHRVEICT